MPSTSSGGTRPSPGGRALNWIVADQPRTTRAAVCRCCHLVFDEGETRICTQGDRRYGRWVHPECVTGGLRNGMQFTPDTPDDLTSARQLTDQLAHRSVVQPAEDPREVDYIGGLEPPTADSPLPASEFFASLKWEDVRKLQGDTFVQVPARFEGAFCDAMGVAIREICTTADQSRIITGWKAFLIVPWLLLQRPPDNQSGDSCAALLTERLDRFWQGDVKSLYREQIGLSRCKSTKKDTGLTDAMRAKKVKTLARARETGRALRATHDTPRVRVTDDVVKELRALYPQSNDTDGDVEMAETPYESIDLQSLIASLSKELKRLPRLSTPGPLSMRNEHLVLLATSTEHATDLATMLARLAVGEAPSEVVDFLRGGLIIPHEKPDGGIRPLTLANVVRRAALKALIHQRKKENAEAVGHLQYGVARKAGGDALYKSLQCRLTACPDSVLIGIDFKAAFQNISRSKIRRAINKYAPWLKDACEAWYGGAATHIVYDLIGKCHEIASDRGVDQGCPLGAFLFALALREPSEDVLAYALSLDPKASLYFYLDDGYIICKADAADRILAYLKQVFSNFGLELNETKLQVWTAQPSQLPETLRAFYNPKMTVLKRQLQAPGDIDHHGAPVAAAQHTLDEEINRLQTLTAQLQRLVKAGLDLQTALAMLRAYAGPASQYTLRFNEVTPESAAAYDVALASAWSKLLGREVSSDNARLWLPLRMGGCGAASARSRMFAAPWAAWCAVSDDLIRHMGANDVESLFEIVPAIGQRISELHAKLVNQGTVGNIAYIAPARAMSLGVSQKFLVSHAHKQILRTLRANMSTDEAAFLRTSSGQGAGGFLEVPLDDRWVMTNSRFSTAALRRMGIPYAAHSLSPAVMPICPNTTAQGRVCGIQCDADGQHLECCAPGGGLMARHDGIVRCLGVLAARNFDPKPKLEQVIPELAQTVHGQIGQARLDVVIHDGIARMLVDVVVVSPYAGSQSFRVACARRDGHAARRAAIAKRSRYDSADLVPFALETGGRLGADARALLMKLADAADDRDEEIQFLYRAVSSVLQDGVARQLQVSA